MSTDTLCKRNPQTPVSRIFAAPDTEEILESNSSPREVIQPVVIPAQKEMEAINKELVEIYEYIRTLPPLWIDSLEAHRKRKKLSIAEVARRSWLSETTIYKYKSNPHFQPKVTVVLAFIISLNLHPLYAYDVLAKANYNVLNPSPLNYFIQHLINYHHRATIEVWNQRFKEAGFDIVLPGVNDCNPDE